MPCPLAPTPRRDAGLRPIKRPLKSPSPPPPPPCSTQARAPCLQPIAAHKSAGTVTPYSAQEPPQRHPHTACNPRRYDADNDGNQVDDDGVAEGDGGGDVEGNGDGDAEGSGEGDTAADAEGDDSGDAAAVTTRRRGRRQRGRHAGPPSPPPRYGAQELPRRQAATPHQH
ncbi:hypothetical protein EDB85DRAFT_553005 [Lactarius pseudohatsudake]|nr:hypothetical protein EDB85DRAFT_553005 [Lactarius pseudohatsudake]